MRRTAPHAFSYISHTLPSHFGLYYYAATFHVINYIQRSSEDGGEKLESTFDKYPFLGRYFAEMYELMPDDLTWSDAIKWWQQEIQTWEEECDIHLPLRTLVQEGGIGFNSCLAFMTTGLVEEDSRFGTLFADLQAPLGQRRPTIELVAQIIAVDGAVESDEDSRTICTPLLRAGLVEVLNRQAPRSEWVLRVPPLLWDAARGHVDGHGEPWYRYYKPGALSDSAGLIYPEEFIQNLNNIPHLLTSGKVRSLILRSDYGSDPLEVIGALARSMHSGIVSVDGKSDIVKEQVRLLGPFCTLSRSIPVLHYDLGPGETIEPPVLDGYHGPTFFVLGFEGGIDNRTTKNSLTLNLPVPDHALRERYWRRALNNHHIEDFDTITGMFHLSGGYIEQVAHSAAANAGLSGRETVTLEDVQKAGRSLNRQHLDTLAVYLDSRGSWDDLVATKTTTEKLRELEQRCRHRERLLDFLGPAFCNNSNQGVRALFTGASGTGKTLAAKILASELGLDLYRVDLAAVINKYIGETEKNLHKVLSRAEALDVVLLLDEGDALLGTRTDVKTANDRYANLETNYLLQRLETYQGIVVVATNLGENIDPAFQRRMDVVVPFFPPQAEERLRILELHLPFNHVVDPDYVEHVALRCDLTGAQIRNASLHAALLALNDRSPVDQYHLEEALRSEFRKAGSTFPLSNNHKDDYDMDGGMEAFVNALRSQ